MAAKMFQTYYIVNGVQVPIYVNVTTVTAVDQNKDNSNLYQVNTTGHQSFVTDKVAAMELVAANNAY